MRVLLIAAPFLLLWAPPAIAEMPYVVQQSVLEAGTRATAELYSAMGTREVRALGAQGVETGARLRLGLGAATIEATGARIDGARSGWTGGVEVLTRVVDSQRAGVDLDLAAGVRRDGLGALVPRARVVVGRTWGRLNTQVSALAERPLASHRDALDVVLGAGAAWRLTPFASVGVEALAEDVEGFWDASEAEGGVHALVGPVVRLRWGRTSLSALVAATRGSAIVGAPASTGGLARLGVGLAF